MNALHQTHTAPAKAPSGWRPRFLCDSLRSPIILSDGRVTTCTLDHNGQNQLADIHEHSFEEVVARYSKTRYAAMASPISKPMCHRCYTRVTSWKERLVPRAGWMQPKFEAAAVARFEDLFQPQELKMNIELSAKCNLRCIGCGVSDPNFTDMRRAMNIDMDRLKEWVAPGVDQISQLRLYHMGETWNHPRWAEFCRYVKDLNPGISLFTSTNGMPLRTQAMLEEVVDVGFDHVVFSIHGSSNASCRQYMGDAFDLEKALAAARALSHLRKQLRASKPYLSWKYVLFTWNDSEEEIARAKTLCDESGFDEIHFTITSAPSPSQRFTHESEAWGQLRDACAGLWPRAADYQKSAPMAAIYPGRHQRLHWNPDLRGAPSPEPQKGMLNQETASAHVSIETLAATGCYSDVFNQLQARAPEARTRGEEQRLAEACYALGRHEEALEAYEKVVSSGEPSDFQLLALARTLQKLGRHDDAIAAFDRGLSRREQLGGRLYGEEVFLELRASLLALDQQAEADSAQRLWIEQSYLREPRSRVIYAPIPKNACTYLKTALVLNGPNADAFQAGEDDAHKFIRRHGSGHRLENAELLQSARFFRFAVLRNPFKRLASAYANIAVRPLRWRTTPDAPMHPLVFSHQRRHGARLDLTEGLTFEAFIEEVAAAPDHELDYHFRSQASFLPDIDAFDLVGDCDNLTPVLEALQGRRWSFDGVGERNATQYAAADGRDWPRSTPQEMHAAGGVPAFSALFDARLVELVRARFEDDFALFEAQFGPVANPGENLIYPTGGALVFDSNQAPRQQQAPARGKAHGPDQVVTLRAEPARAAPDEAQASVPGPASHYEIRQEGAEQHISCNADTLQAALNEAGRLKASGASVRVILMPGVYRGTYRLKGSGAPGGALAIEAQTPGTVTFSGSDPIGGWRRSPDGLWSAPWPHRFELSAAPPDYGDPWLATPELMRHREAVIVDEAALRQVLERDRLTAGSFWIDSAENEVWLHPPGPFDPSASRVEAGVRSTLLHLSGLHGLEIKGLRFVHDSTGFYTPQTAALRLTDCAEARVEACSFARNNNKGLQVDGRASSEITLCDLTFVDNGCLGLLASRVDGLTLERVTFTGNNQRGGWAGHYRGSPAGAKIMKSRRVRVSKCRAVRNLCTGVWLDERNSDVVIADSVFAGNYRGLHIEASHGPVLIENCTITDNRREPTPTVWAWRFGSGLAITHAQDVTVRGCTLSGNDTAQIGVRDDRETRRLTDSLTHEQTEEFTSGLLLEGNTILAGYGQSCLRVPGPDFDQGRCWASLVSSDNLYAAAEPKKAFRISGKDLEHTLGFDDWVGRSGQDTESQFHG